MKRLHGKVCFYVVVSSVGSLLTTQTQCVHCTVRTRPNIIDVGLSLSALPWLRRPIVGLSPRRPGVCHRSGICGGINGIGAGFGPSTSVLSCQYYSTNAPHSSLSTCCSYRKYKWAKPGNLRQAALYQRSGICGQQVL